VAAYEGALASPRLGRGDRALAGNNLGLLYRNKQRRHDDAERVAPAPGARAPLCAVRRARVPQPCRARPTARLRRWLRGCGRVELLRAACVKRLAAAHSLVR
jgi:hypothetical protein